MDETTVRRAQRGDAASLEVVLRDLAPYLGRICGAIALDAGDDALQEAMVAISRNLRSLREPAALRGWARRIAVREAVRAGRGGRAVPVDPATLDPVGLDPRVVVADGTTAVEVRAVLSALPPEHRAVLVLRHLDGLDEAEMADVLGVARGTVKSRLHRARAAFREEVDGMSPTWTDLGTAAMADPWPTATLDPGARVRALAAGLPGAVVQEGVLDAPFAEVWGFISDLERSVPRFDDDVAALRVVERDGTRLRVRARSSWRMAGVPLGFDVDLEEGWCWMVSRPRLYVVAMAAAPHPDEPDRTRYAHLEGIAVRGRALTPLLRATRWRTRRHVASDVAGIERALGIRA